jgi:pyruvate dehydrogenase E1 component beta subunit
MVKMTVREALRDAMAEEMRRDEDVFVMGEEVAEYQGAYKITQGLLQEFGDRRVIDTPITEHGFAGVGVGAAMAGLKPIVEFMTFNFAMQAIDQIINSAAKTLYMSGGQMGCSIVFRGPNGRPRASPHSTARTIRPGTRKSGPQGRLAVFGGGRQGPAQGGDPRPEPGDLPRERNSLRSPGDVPKLDDYVVPIGKARIARPGKDVTLIAWSNGMTYALNAADELAKEGIEAEVIDLRTLRPMDTETIINSVKKTSALLWSRKAGSSPASARRSRADHGAGVRLSRRAGGACRGQGRADALRGEPRKAPLPSVAEVVDAAKAVMYR